MDVALSLVAGAVRSRIARCARAGALTLVAAALALPAAAAGGAAPEPGSAAALLGRAFSNLYAEDYIQTLVIQTQSRGGKEMRRRLQITRRQSVRPGKALLRFLYPEAIRRTSVLVLENEDRTDDLYVYLPAVKLTRHLSAAQRGDSFFGTDLSYEDVEPKHIGDYDVRWASAAEVEPAQAAEAEAAGCALVEIRGTPAFESAYERQIACIERDRAIMLWSDFYTLGRHLKRLTIDLDEIRRIGERNIPFLITIETPRHRSVTKVITEDYDLRAEIDDRLFNTWNLAAGDAKGDRRKTVPAEPTPAERTAHTGE